jgi:hypothetical protein
MELYERKRQKTWCDYLEEKGGQVRGAKNGGIYDGDRAGHIMRKAGNRTQNDSKSAPRPTRTETWDCVAAQIQRQTTPSTAHLLSSI